MLRIAFLCIILSVLIFPLYWMVKTSFENEMWSITVPPSLIPRNPTLHSYREIMAYPIWRWTLNSILLVVGTTTFTTLTSLAAAYGLEKFQWRYKEVVFWLIILPMAIPGLLTLLPKYTALNHLRLTDTLFGAALPYLFSAISVLLLRGYLRNLPRSLIESSEMEGASALKRFTSIVLPLSKPMALTVSVLHIISVWKGYLWQLLLLDSFKKRTLIVGVADAAWGIMQNEPRVIMPEQRFGMSPNYGAVCAGAVLTLIPLLLLFLTLRKRFIEGAKLL